MKDFAIYGADIFTADSRNPWAEAMLVRNGRIACVGTCGDVRREAGGSVEVFELPGRLVTPGLVDAHCHFVSLGFYLQRVDLRDCTSIRACRDRIKAAAGRLPKGSWVLGRGWDQNRWEDGREPTAADLDDIVPDHPVLMVRVCGHVSWVNSRALESAGITAQTPDPPGGSIDRDPVSGNPNGLIREARYIIEDHIPPVTRQARLEAVGLAARQCHQNGLTGVHSMEYLADWLALAELDQSGDLPLRVYQVIMADDLEALLQAGITPDTGSDFLRTGHLKLFADGSLGGHTALMHAPYLDQPDNCGLPILQRRELIDKVAKAYDHGFRVAIHAIGDKAVTHALDAIEANRNGGHPNPRPDRIEHIQLFREEDLERFCRYRITASIQPKFVVSDWQVAERLWGRERCRHGYAWRTLARAGLDLIFGTDAPVELNNPLLNLQAAVTRQNPDGQPAGGWFPDQRLDLAESLIAYTLKPAVAAGWDDRLGSLTPGKQADITVFGRNLFQVPPEQWHTVDIDMTIVNGKIVHSK